MPTVRGTIVLDNVDTGLRPARIHVRLQDTSLADAPSRLIREVVIPRGPDTDRGEEQRVAFCIDAGEINPRVRYEVSVLVDLDNDGKIGVGDYHNTRSYPVLTFGNPDRVEIRVEPVR